MTHNKEVRNRKHELTKQNGQQDCTKRMDQKPVSVKSNRERIRQMTYQGDTERIRQKTYQGNCPTHPTPLTVSTQQRNHNQNIKHIGQQYHTERITQKTSRVHTEKTTEKTYHVDCHLPCQVPCPPPPPRSRHTPTRSRCQLSPSLPSPPSHTPPPLLPASCPHDREQPQGLRLNKGCKMK